MKAVQRQARLELSGGSAPDLLSPPPPNTQDALMPDCGVHYLWFAFVCFFIRSHPPRRQVALFGHAGNVWCLYPTLIADV